MNLAQAVAVVRPILIATLILTIVMLPTQGQAQNTLIVGTDGLYSTIEDALVAAETGDVIEVHGGVYPAPLLVNKTVKLIGIDRPVIDGQGKGSLVLLNAPEGVFKGFVVRSSGQSLAHEDTGIVIQAPRVTVADNVLEDVMFGIYFANAPDGIARNNTIVGKPLEASMRGDGIRVWYSDYVQLIGNEITLGRDTLIWYANHITIRGNHIHNNRYGLHFMYNKNAVIENNVIENNAVGAYMMYSGGLEMTGNYFIHNRGASGYGIAFKDMDHAQVTDNLFVGNMTAVYLDNSPSLVDEYNSFLRNFIAYNDIGLMGLPSVKRNIFRDNTFLENYQQISVQGRGDLLGNVWSQDGVGNYWSDYVGYDADHDGLGDMPYRAEKLFESLTDREPALKLFAFNPASQSIDLAASAFPALRPDPKVIDETPKMDYVMPSGLEEPAPGAALPAMSAALLLLSTGATVSLLAWRRKRWRHNPAKRAEAVQARV